MWGSSTGHFPICDGCRLMWCIFVACRKVSGAYHGIIEKGLCYIFPIEGQLSISAACLVAP